MVGTLRDARSRGAIYLPVPPSSGGVRLRTSASSHCASSGIVLACSSSKTNVSFDRERLIRHERGSRRRQQRWPRSPWSIEPHSSPIVRCRFGTAFRRRPPRTLKKPMSDDERSTLKSARSAGLMSGFAALFVCAQWYLMRQATFVSVVAANAAADQSSNGCWATRTGGKALDHNQGCRCKPASILRR